MNFLSTGKVIATKSLKRAKILSARFLGKAVLDLGKLRESLQNRRARTFPDTPGQRITGDGLYLEASRLDTLSGLIGKLRRIESLEIILKIPEDATNFRELATWLRFAAYVKQSGQTIAVSSTDHSIHQLAKTVGIPIASSEWYFGPSIRLQRLGWTIFRKFSKALVLLLLLGIGWFGSTVALDHITHATIQISPSGEERSVDIIFAASDLIQDSDLKTRVIKARSVREETDATVVVAVSGEDSLGLERATANIEFVNSSSKNYSVASGFLVGTKEGINFKTTVSITLAPNESKKVTAVCDLPGILGNVNALTITESTLPVEITATNPEAATGGIDTTWPIVDARDILTAHKYSRDVLISRGIKALEIDDTAQLVTGTVSTPILSQQARQAIGDQSEVFVIDYVIVASGLVIDFSEARSLAEMMLISTLERNEELIGLTKLDVVDSPELGSDKVRIRATGRVIATDNWARDLSSPLRSASFDEASTIVEEYLSLSHSPIITLTPSFLPLNSLPQLARNIEIQLLVAKEDEAFSIAQENEDD